MLVWRVSWDRETNRPLLHDGYVFWLPGVGLRAPVVSIASTCGWWRELTQATDVPVCAISIAIRSEWGACWRWLVVVDGGVLRLGAG